MRKSTSCSTCSVYWSYYQKKTKRYIPLCRDRVTGVFIPVMKLSLAIFNLLALVASSNAQYFSAGWSPGQKQPEAQSPVQPVDNLPTPTPIAEPVKPTSPLSLLDLFDTNKLLTSGPSVALFNRLGINITEKVEASSNIWDERIPLITDDNYEDLVVNEILTEQEEADRVWIIVMYVSLSYIPAPLV